MHRFKFYRQNGKMECGATCLKMISNYYGKCFKTDFINNIAGLSKQGVTLLGISDAAEYLGFKCVAARLSLDELLEEATKPCILHWNQDHFVVFIPNKKKNNNSFRIADPAKGIFNCTKKEFTKSWCAENEIDGIALFLEPQDFFLKNEIKISKVVNWKVILTYFKPVSWSLAQVLIALIVSSFLQLIFPFLTKSLVDNGINSKNLSFVTIILLGQLMLVISRNIVDFIRNNLLLRISLVVNLSLLSDFWVKIMKLPISYFDSQSAGDVIQRTNDSNKIQEFISGPLLNTLFGTVNLFVFSYVLIKYSISLYLIFLIASVVYVIWINFFLAIKRDINFKVFDVSAKEVNSTFELINGIKDIKLNNAQDIKRKKWEKIQIYSYKIKLNLLRYNQLEQAGAVLINQSKDILITFFVASMVINGSLSFGTMLAIQYVMGQISSPIEQIVSLVQSGQNAKISLERLNNLHEQDDEIEINKSYVKFLDGNEDLIINNLSFAYPGQVNNRVLKNVNLIIPSGKTTAIVGSSGSGKTTLLKLLLKFYYSYSGEIKIGDHNFCDINPALWRNLCSSVLQDGYLFNESIRDNILLSDVTDEERLISSCEKAQILSFIDSLPKGFDTLIGSEGLEVSQGQKQRILIARAIYRDSKYIFFDEATNALDAINEQQITENLRTLFEDKTVIIVAHRLSTIRNADQIVVLNDGQVAEFGTHNELVKYEGIYSRLISKQLQINT
jgi:ATP-binding cassette subfamily B protein